MTRQGSGPLVDGLLLGAGTFTAVTVPPPGAVDRRRGATALLAAPGLGALLALVAGAFGWLVIQLADLAGNSGPLVCLLAAALAVAAMAWSTRGLHLDGLADLADGLGSYRTGEAALAVMRDPRTGAFGVVSLVVVLALQICALGVAYAGGHGLAALVAAGVSARATLAWGCRRGTPADGSGLGRAVVGSTSPRSSLLIGIGWTALAAGAAVLSGISPLAAGAAAAACWGAAALVRRRALRRLDAVTGDVLGAMVEISATVSLVVLAVLS